MYVYGDSKKIMVGCESNLALEREVRDRRYRMATAILCRNVWWGCRTGIWKHSREIVIVIPGGDQNPFQKLESILGPILRMSLELILHMQSTSL